MAKWPNDEFGQDVVASTKCSFSIFVPEPAKGVIEHATRVRGADEAHGAHRAALRALLAERRGGHRGGGRGEERDDAGDDRLFGADVGDGVRRHVEEEEVAFFGS